jgi:hypothetical protein
MRSRSAEATHIGQEICHQKLHGLEDIPFLAILNVSGIESPVRQGAD